VFESRVLCMGMVPQRCLLVREVGGAEIGLWYEGIAGFTHEPGYRYRLEVEVERLANPPADGADRRYTLRRILSREPSPRPELLELTAAAEAKWDILGPLHYSMVQRVDCFCAEAGIGAVRMEVIALLPSLAGRSEEVLEVRREDNGAVLSQQEAALYLSVVHLFRFIYWSIARDADRIDVEFDDRYGHPSRISVDPSHAISDDELEYTVQSITER
jgi:hypothetical protein